MMASLAVTKVLATSCTIGSGGSGGVFGLSLFIGSMLGGVVGKLGNLYYFPGVVEQPGRVIGMLSLQELVNAYHLAILRLARP